MKVKNPIIWADYPDPDIIRDGDVYYMVTTTMFYIPAAPIMKSYDLIHWEIVSYVETKIDGYDNVGTGFGRGQWATSLRKHGSKYYVFFSCLDLNKSYLYSTDNIEKTGWDRIVFNRIYHDATLLFDDENAYLIYKSGSTSEGDICILRFKEDMSGIIDDSDHLLFVTPMEGILLAAEGARGFYRNGWYYLFFIDIPDGGIRREWCYRARNVEGPYERRIIADSRAGHRNFGVAQGMTVDTPEGDWYMILFGDAGSVGRIPFLFPVSWEQDWPVVGAGEGMKLEYDVPLKEHEAKPLIYSDSFNHAEDKIGLFWQWNHNPDDTRWSFTKNPGKLTLYSSPAENLLYARNTLTQRTCGPGCEFTVEVDTAGLQPGDEAGIAALQWDFASVGISVDTDGGLHIKAKKRTASQTEPDGTVKEYYNTSLTEKKVWLKAVFDFVEEVNTVRFCYSVNGAEWIDAGEEQPINFNMRMFVGTRIALYCFGNGGGSAGFNNFTAKVV